ncbi:hypothetical protein ACH5RR_027023 [Cinchona calisaya]|uniref:SWIM-type domain-containing protein n=1 Tax=Cinchona calisaya TaxID=153742 RepID=A0ABD2Z488_9GENT
MYGENFVVDLEKWVCDCRRWELTGIPCSHAICCIQVIDEEPERFVNQCYSKNAYVRAYTPVMDPIKGSNTWPDSKKDPIHALKKLKLPIRPKKARRKELDEQKTDPKATKMLTKFGNSHDMLGRCRGNQVEILENRENGEISQARVEVANIEPEMLAAQQNHNSKFRC